MDRNIVYPGAIPLDTDLLNVQRNTMIALGFLAQATLGTGPVAAGLAVSATSPATMSVVIAPGSLTTAAVVDTTAFGSIAADTTDALVKMGINLTSTSLTLTAPTTAGQSQNYLVQAGFSESDAVPVVLPYYNASNPAQPYAGPGNGGGSQNTQRIQRVTLQLKAGAPASTGSQTTPAADTGFVGLYAITVTNGQTQITTANLASGNPYGAALVPTAPFVTYALGQLRPAIPTRVPLLSGSGNWTVPAGVTRIKVTAIGAGGGGGGCTGGNSGAGGGAGAMALKTLTVTPGQVFPYAIGGGGLGGANGQGANGTSTTFGTSLITAAGGQGGQGGGASTAAGGIGGTATGGDENYAGGTGNDGNAGSATVSSGYGAAGPFGGQGRSGAGGGNACDAQSPGAGGGGAYNGSGPGGKGGGGAVYIEY